MLILEEISCYSNQWKSIWTAKTLQGISSMYNILCFPDRMLSGLAMLWCRFVDWDTIILSQTTSLQNGKTASISRPFDRSVSWAAPSCSDRRPLHCSWNPCLSPLKAYSSLLLHSVKSFLSICKITHPGPCSTCKLVLQAYMQSM